MNTGAKQKAPLGPLTALSACAAGVLLLLAIATVVGILYFPATARIEGLFLILLAVVADCFLAGFLSLAAFIAQRGLNRPDLMTDIFRRHHRLAGNMLSGLFVIPMLIAIVRILSLE